MMKNKKLEKILGKAYQLKEETYGEAGYLTPRDIRPIMWCWGASLVLLVVGLFVLDWVGKGFLVAVWLLLNYGFFNAGVRL